MLKKIMTILLVCVFAVPGFAAAIELSADQVMSSKGQAMNAKIYIKGDKWRMESVVQGMKSVTIIRGDKKVSWMLMPDQKMYMENKIDARQTASLSRTAPGEVKREKIGREKVNGVDCDKFKVVYKNANVTDSMYSWVASDSFPIKTEAVDGSWSSELKNIKKGAQPNSLFEIPAGYNKMSMPPMGGMPFNMH